jgi:multidrug efflux pump subunit AcrA (membrane-fusion protein)
VAGCTAATKTPVVSARPVTVQRGNLDVTVSVDGNLNMPQAFDLHFGAPGNVLNINVKEGDIVKAGTILATLDDTSQALAIKTANNKVQTDLSNLYETVPRLPQFRTNYYIPTAIVTTPINTVSAVTMFNTDIPAPPSIGSVTTTINTTTGVTSDLTVTTTIGFQTVQAAIGAVAGTTQVTTTVNATQTVTKLAAPEGVHNEINYPSYYPTGTILDGYYWYQQDMGTAQQLFQSENYTEASSELSIASADLQSVIMMINDAINNPQSGLGNTAPVVNDQNITYMDIMGQDSGAGFYIQALRKDVDQIKQSQADISTTIDLISQKKYDEATAQYQVALAGMAPIGTIVYTNYNILNVPDDTTVYGKDLSVSFFNAAEDKMNAAATGMEKDGLNSPDLETNLRIAEHYMLLSNAILGVNDYVLQHGLSMKNQAQYNVNLANDLVALKDCNKNFLNTVILAPFDGIVVAVNLKTNDVLSAIDYASKGDIQMVDTSQIEFKGLVDEIDITKIKPGQNASITVDAVPNKTFTGKVSFISPYGTADSSGVVHFNVTILLDPTDVALKGMLTSTADIAVSTAENALILPLTAITTAKDGSSSVTVITSDNKTEKRPVTLGMQNAQSAVVLTGVNQGDRVIIQESAAGAPTTTRPQGAPGGGGGGAPPGR